MSYVSDFRPREFSWSAPTIARFWDWRSESSNDVYFSSLVADALIGLVRRSVGFRGKVLDFGCGPGHLLRSLCRSGIECEGAEFSERSVRAAERLLSDSGCGAKVTRLDGFPTPFRSDGFGVVFLVETIEHLLPDERERVLRELNRIVESGGTLVVTTPNAENLAASSTICPACGSIFHPMQHVSSWSARALEAELRRYGFQVRLLQPMFLMDSWWKSRLVTLASALLRRTPPHLVAIAQKRASTVNAG